MKKTPLFSFRACNGGHRVHSPHAAQGRAGGQQAGEQRRCGGLKHGDGGEGDPLQRIGDGGLYQDGAPVACGSAQYGCGGAVIDPLPQKGAVQVPGAHADGALYADLAQAGMDVGEYGVDDVEYADGADEQDQAPAEQGDLSIALRQLPVGVLIGEPVAAAAGAQRVQPRLQRGAVGPLGQGEIELVVAGQRARLRR